MDNEIKVNSTTVNKIKVIVENIIYYSILIPLILITFSIFLQQIKNPNKIPNILGRKLFMVLEDDKTCNIKANDLIVTKNINLSKLKIGDVIAFRNSMDTVTIHKIKDITLKDKTDDNGQDVKVKAFVMEAEENETEDLKNVLDYNVEGIVVKRYGMLRWYITVCPKASSNN